MATFGDSTINAFWASAETKVFGLEFTLANASTLNYIRARLRETTTANAHQVKALVYDANTNALVAESASRQDIATTEATYDFTFSTLLGAGDYYACVFISSGSGQCELAYDAPFTGEGVGEDSFTFPTEPDPLTPVVQDVRFSISGDYTESGGGGGVPRFIAFYRRLWNN